MNLLFEIEDTPAPDIEGLSYVPNFITADEEAALITKIEEQPWLIDLKRRVQHYGYKYDYTARRINSDAYLGELPDWLSPLCHTLYEGGVFSKLPDQVIVNEYLSGQGISAHVDCVPCFGDVIASLSLGSDAMMQFKSIQNGSKQEVFLRKHSLISLSNEARYQWQHAIPARKYDRINGFKMERGRRISLTFRTVIL